MSQWIQICFPIDLSVFYIACMKKLFVYFVVFHIIVHIQWEIKNYRPGQALRVSEG